MTHFKEIFPSPKKGITFGYYDKSQISKSKNYYASLKVENFYDYLLKMNMLKLVISKKILKNLKL